MPIDQNMNLISFRVNVGLFSVIDIEVMTDLIDSLEVFFSIALRFVAVSGYHRIESGCVIPPRGWSV